MVFIHPYIYIYIYIYIYKGSGSRASLSSTVSSSTSQDLSSEDISPASGVSTSGERPDNCLNPGLHNGKVLKIWWPTRVTGRIQ